MKIIEVKSAPQPTPPPTTYVVELTAADMRFIAAASYSHEINIDGEGRLLWTDLPFEFQNNPMAVVSRYRR